MKLTARDDFRVNISGQVEIKRLPYGTPALTELVERIDLTGTVYPRRLGDFGSFSMSDSMLPGKNRDIPAEYERRCQEIVRTLRDQYGTQVKAEVVCTTEETCSHCGYAWDEMTQEHVEKHPDWLEHPRDGAGLPLCCEDAQNEWRAAQPPAASETHTGGFLNICSDDGRECACAGGDDPCAGTQQPATNAST